jgi:hypothetical protein
MWWVGNANTAMKKSLASGVKFVMDGGSGR